MKIWLVRDLEPIPTDPGTRRLMRMGMLAQSLARLGHSTRWITSSFDHYQKRQRSPRSQEFTAETDLTITVLPGPGYKRNIGLARIRHNRTFARSFLRFARTSAERPDVIVTDIPTTEAAAAAIAFGKECGVPTVLSIRDLWPDFFGDYLPVALRPLARLALVPLERQVRFACANATSLIGISPGYLQWGIDKGGRAPSPIDKMFPLGYAPRPIADEATTNAFLQRTGIRPEAKVVSFVGSWGHTYDLPLVLEAARLLADRSDIQFVIAGEGVQSEQLRPRFAALPNVVLTDWIDAEEIGIVLRRSEAGLLPYHSAAPQGWPNKVFEYLAYGTYQIATIEGELARLYQETGGGVALGSHDPEALAHAIVQALDNPALALNRGGRIDEFEKRFSSHAIYAAMSDHITRVAEFAVEGASSGSRLTQ
ncbi:glycosyltransferase family 4 protein [uncultured Nitratireductor sp.]|uniref:glycosyltransferase family 4 protein n=1 Tax=uncultured Nitratireductor sp. TaxID=520953 RepID=UPI0025DF7F33|nr:glycosyltransferase family 4 protein [uncultured Nitratireductor sp.]